MKDSEQLNGIVAAEEEENGKIVKGPIKIGEVEVTHRVPKGVPRLEIETLGECGVAVLSLQDCATLVDIINDFIKENHGN